MHLKKNWFSRTRKQKFIYTRQKSWTQKRVFGKTKKTTKKVKQWVNELGELGELAQKRVLEIKKKKKKK